MNAKNIVLIVRLVISILGLVCGTVLITQKNFGVASAVLLGASAASYLIHFWWNSRDA